MMHNIGDEDVCVDCGMSTLFVVEYPLCIGGKIKEDKETTKYQWNGIRYSHNPVDVFIGWDTGRGVGYRGATNL